MKKTLLLILLNLFIFSAFSATCTMTLSSTATGNDSDPTSASVLFSGAPSDAVITAVSVTASIVSPSGTSWCPDWYTMDIYANGVWNLDLCDGTYDVSGMAGLAVNGQYFQADSWDADSYSDNVTVSISVTITYTTSGSCSSGCNWQICLEDSAGDGWNGASVSIYVNGAGLGSATLSTGSGPECYIIPFSEGDDIQIDFSSGSYDGECSYYLTDANGTVFYNSGASPDNISITDAECVVGTGTCSSSITIPPGSDGSICSMATAFCAEPLVGVTYETQIDNGIAPTGPNYGCVCEAGANNPTWLYMQIGTSGPITMQITSSCGDVDYAAWGPFSAPTCDVNCLTSTGTICTTTNYSAPAGNMIDCAYSTASVETLDIPYANVGEFYMIMIANYANCSGTITFNQISGSGSTDCSIVAPPISNNGPLCVGETLSLTANNPPAGATFLWTGPNGWSSTQQNPTIANVTTAMSGTYSLVITVGGVTSAPVTTSVLVNAYPSGVTVSPSTANLTCTVTSINLTASATSPTTGLTYSWSNGATSATTTVSTAGTYTVTVSNNGCTTTASATLSGNTINPTVSVSASATTLTCSTTNSTITSNATPTSGLTYNWSNGATTANITVTTPGTYTVTVTNTSNGCTATAQQVITQNITAPTAAITNNSGTTILTCNQTNISLTASGGNSYAWNNGLGTNPTVSISNAGTYIVTVTGTNGCTATAQQVISQNIAPPTAGINPPATTVLTCTTTSISLTATGGGTYSWSNGASTANTTISAAGTYTVTVTGTNGCTATAQQTITQNSSLPAAGINTPPTSVLTCTTTSIPLTATGGGTYSWSNGASTANTTINTAGTYTVTVIAANGCSATAQQTITQNITAPTAGINSPPSTVLTCTTTSIPLTATGGGTYSWSNGLGNNANATVTAAGTYTVTVTATNGCTDTESIVITNDSSIPTITITNNSGTTELTCNQTNISLTANGGNSYVWSNGLGTNAIVSVNNSGTYTVTGTNTNGCSGVAQITITQNITPPTAGINPPATTVLTCTTTSIPLTATGGVTYSWSNGATTANTSITTPGTYTVTITGTNGCTATAQQTITQNSSLPTAAINTPPTSVLTCTTTSIPLTATGGGTYSWSNGANTANTTITTPGTYTVTVTSANGCSATAQQIITQNTTAPSATITNNSGTTELSCSQTNISLTASGGNSYAWNNGLNNTANVTITNPGNYIVTVTEANGCTATAQISITQNSSAPVVGINAPATTTLTCATTSISLTATGGVSYAWSNGLGTNANVSVSNPGTYTVTATGTNGCTATAQQTITQNITPPTVGITNNTGTTILTCSTTSISLTATGGDTYSWSNGDAVANTTITTAGTYTVTATGVNGCTASNNISITAATPLLTSFSSYPIRCHGETTTITVTASGGTTPYNGIGTFVVTSGTYQYTVTDNGGCSTSTGPIVINEPQILEASYVINSDIVCYDGYASVLIGATGGTTPYIGTGLKEVPAGNYNFEITDANGCKDILSFSINQPPEITAEILQTEQIKCYGAPQGALMVYANGGHGNFSYLWNDRSSSTTDVATNLIAATYTVTVTDSEGCEETATATIVEPSKVGIDISIKNISCFGEADGKVDYVAFGGIAPYTYSFSGNGVHSNFLSQRNLKTGEYTISINDKYSCTYDTIIYISEPPQLICDVDVTNPTCIEGKNGIIRVYVTGGISPYEYFLNGISYKNKDIITHLDKGTYLVSVIDSMGCNSAETTYTLIDRDKKCLDIPTAITPDGDNFNETWILEGIENFDNYEVSIFNRWGQQLLKSDDYKPWDGMYKGKKVPSGTYLYVIMIYGKKLYSGTLNVIY